MAAVNDLKAAGIIERDENNDVLWTWSYPSVSSEHRNFLMFKSGLGGENTLPLTFVYGRWKEAWYYMQIVDVTNEDTNLPKVTHFALVLMSRDFNPEKYSTLCHVFSRQYKKTGSAADILQSYLSVATRGTCNNDENGKFSINDYNKQQAYAKTCIKDIIQRFGLETILLYSAVLLKKRVAVYFPAHSLHHLLDYTRTIPAFAWHRQNWDIVFPYVHLTDMEIEDLRSHSHYVAGFTEAAVEGRTDLYDVFINVPSSQIVVLPHAKESFSLGKLHKDIALLMVEKANDDSLSNIQVVKEIANKTKDLLNSLKSLASEDESGKLSLTLEALKEKNMPPATEQFLFSLAACEGLIKL